jgi:mandelamide amidase
MAPLGLAEDTVGSIRVPAALCGIAGFRPTTSRYPSAGVAPISALFDQVGPHARTVIDLALFDAVVTGDFTPVRPAALKGVKLGVARGYWFAGIDAEVERVTQAALRKLEDVGVELVEAEVTDLAGLIQRTTRPVCAHDFPRALTKYLHDSGTSLTFEQVVDAVASPDVKAMITQFGIGGSPSVSEEAYQAVLTTHLPRLRENFRDYFARTGVAAIVFPATMLPAAVIGQNEVTIGNKKLPVSQAMWRNVAPGSTAGLPGLVLPAGLTQSGLPVSLEFDGPSGTDRALLALGLSVESVLGHPPSPKI